MNGDTWRLFRDGQVIGEFVVDGGDFPWLNAGFHPKEGFDQVRKLFKDDLRLLELAEKDGVWEDWERSYGRIRSTLSLAAPDGHHVSEFILHIEGNRAWWRWTDEPFERE